MCVGVVSQLLSLLVFLLIQLRFISSVASVLGASVSYHVLLVCQVFFSKFISFVLVGSNYDMHWKSSAPCPPTHPVNSRILSRLLFLLSFFLPPSFPFTGNEPLSVPAVMAAVHINKNKGEGRVSHW